MVEKRFFWECGDDGIFRKGEKLYTDDEIVDVLNELTTNCSRLKEENEQLKIANAKWLDKALQDNQIRYNNANHKELTRKYLQLKNENEELRQTIANAEEKKYHMKQKKNVV